MHEFSLVGAILETTLDVSRECGGLAVESVHLSIGAQRQVVPEILAFAFAAASEGTVASGAQLLWQTVPVRVRCDSCGATFDPVDVLWACPSCGSPGGTLLQGDELILEKVVLDERSSAPAEG